MTVNDRVVVVAGGVKICNRCNDCLVEFNGAVKCLFCDSEDYYTLDGISRNALYNYLRANDWRRVGEQANACFDKTIETWFTDTHICLLKLEWRNNVNANPERFSEIQQYVEAVSVLSGLGGVTFAEITRRIKDGS